MCYLIDFPMTLMDFPMALGEPFHSRLRSAQYRTEFLHQICSYPAFSIDLSFKEVYRVKKKFKTNAGIVFNMVLKRLCD